MARIFETISKVLIVIGAIIGIHPLAVFFSIPLYSLGLVGLWTSKTRSRESKLRWTIYPLIGIIIAWILILVGTWIYDVLMELI